MLCRIKKAFASIKLQRGETHNCKIKKNELNAATESLSRQNPEGMQLLFSCSVMSDPMDGSLPSSSVYAIPQARILEWVAISFSRVSS